MIEHRLHVTMTLPRPRDEVFAFFANAEHLARITPPELRFRILTPGPIALCEGARIHYRLRLFGVPFSWQTLISEWKPNELFVDQQLRGPYRLWRHTHRFRDVPGGTSIEDEVRWALPLQPAGELVYPVVRRQLDRIFGYREREIRRVFGP